MSHSSSSYHPTSEHRHAPCASAAQSAAAISRHLHRSHNGYTLTHAGHQIRIGPVAFWIVVGALVIMAVWSIATGTYFAFRDNVLTRLIGRQAEMQFAYEDRIAELRAQVDRIMSRQLLDQEQFEQKLNTLLQRQATLEQRTSALTGDPSTTGTIKPARIAPPGATPAKSRPRPSPINDTVIFVAPPDREARLQSRELPAAATRIAERTTAGGLNGMLARISLSLDKVEQRQAATLTDLEERIDTKSTPDAQRAGRSRNRSWPRIGRRASRRAICSGQAAAIRRQRLRTSALPHQCRPRADRPLHATHWSPCQSASPSSAKSI